LLSASTAWMPTASWIRSGDKMNPLHHRLIKDILSLARDCSEIEDSLENDLTESPAGKVACDLLRSYLSEVLSYLSACIHLLKTQEVLESSVKEKLHRVKEFSYGRSTQIVEECFDQIESCKRREDKQLMQDEFLNGFMRKVFEKLKKFTELLHTYSHTSEWHEKRQVSEETYKAVIDSVRKLSERTGEISGKIQNLVSLHQKTKEYIRESQEVLKEYFSLLREGYKDPDLFKTAQENISLAVKSAR